MARQRRGGGFRSPELPLRGTLGTLLRTAAAQVGPLREALERTAREGRSRVEDALAGRTRRTDALAELGEVVLDLIRRGEIDLGELPEVRDIVAHLDELDAGHPSEHDEEFAPPPSRNRFDSRRRDRDDDGTVSSKTWAPPTRPAGKKPASPGAARVWRPPLDNEETDKAHRAADEITARERPVPRPKDPFRKGGISFDDDEDLAEYMHPDDVPPKGSKDGDS
ncbi:MAG TPA: hypothetical protein VLB44_27880 [Kofleriaceae bacterium]|nr:hypothetical protein [Kofleriaceae bacterium]